MRAAADVRDPRWRFAHTGTLPVIQVALFDFDGTLIDSEAVHLACWNRVLATFDARIEADFYGPHCAGHRTEEIAERILRHLPTPAASMPTLAAAKDACYLAWTEAHDLPLMPGAQIILRDLAAAGLRLGLVTGATEKDVHKTLVAHGILECFATRVTRDDVAHGKPAPDSYRLALERLDVPSAAALAFEDTSAGVRSAAAADVLTIAVPNAYTTTHDFSAAHHIVGNLIEARALVLPWLR